LFVLVVRNTYDLRRRYLCLCWWCVVHKIPPCSVGLFAVSADKVTVQTHNFKAATTEVLQQRRAHQKAKLSFKVHPQRKQDLSPQNQSLLDREGASSPSSGSRTQLKGKDPSGKDRTKIRHLSNGRQPARPGKRM